MLLFANKSNKNFHIASYNTSQDMNYYLVNFGQVNFGQVTTDRKRCIRAHRAYSTGVLKNVRIQVKLTFLNQIDHIMTYHDMSPC